MANPGTGTCTFSGHRHLSATNAPGRRHVATPRAHCTKVMPHLRWIPAAGSHPDMGSLAARRPNHFITDVSLHKPPVITPGVPSAALRGCRGHRLAHLTPRP